MCALAWRLVRGARRASLLLGVLRRGWAHAGFGVLLETGYRTVDHPEMADDVAVLFREHPFARRGDAPRVVAGLVEERTDAEPDLVREVRRAGACPSGPVPAGHAAEWLRRYLRISLLPLLALFRTDGVSLEAHVQNSLLHLEDGWPVRFWARDMERTSVCGQRLTATEGLLAADSPLFYPEPEAWLRLKYYVLTNHVGHLVHVLARAGEADEERLWRVVRDVLRAGVADRWTEDLLESPVLPAKANLTSWFTGRGERPLYVEVPNPMCEVSS